MSTTKPDSDTGWSKDVPTTNGWYWLKDDKTGPVLTEALNGCFYVHNSRYMPQPNDEWLGPISPSDFEQLLRLRSVALNALIWMDWWKDPTATAYPDGLPPMSEIITVLRGALAHTGEQS